MKPYRRQVERYEPTLKGRIAYYLRRYNRLILRHPRVTLTLLPLNTTLQFEGTPLRELITPQIEGDAAHRRHILDAYLSPLVTFEGDSEKDLVEVAGTVGPSLLAFMQNKGGKPSTFYEGVVRLIFALGNTEGATMEITDNTILVTHDHLTYGIKAGAVVSRFCTGMELGIGNPLEIVSRTETVEMQDPLFALLYREAYLRGKHLVHALTAIRTGDPAIDFKTLIAEDYRPKVSERTLKRWEDVINEDPDPVGVLYRAMVPTLMTRQAFTKHIGSVQHRAIDMSETSRIRLLNKVYMYFNQQGKEQK